MAAIIKISYSKIFKTEAYPSYFFLHSPLGEGAAQPRSCCGWNHSFSQLLEGCLLMVHRCISLSGTAFYQSELSYPGYNSVITGLCWFKNPATLSYCGLILMGFSSSSDIHGLYGSLCYKLTVVQFLSLPSTPQ